MSHTPGPWTFAPDDNHRGVPIVSAVAADRWGRVVIADLYEVAEVDANARLIAAAPDLLDEARTARAVIATACGESAPFARIALARLDAVIAKAEGSDGRAVEPLGSSAAFPESQP